MRFKDQVAIVTGAASGIGKATAIKFAQEGAHIVICDRDEEQARPVAESIETLDRRCQIIPMDVSDSPQVQSAIDQAIATMGQVDVVVNNAGINLRKPPQEITDDDWNNVIGINLNGVWFFCRYILPHFLQRGRGVIVNIASIGAFQASYDRAPYMAAKGGVVGLTQALAADLAEENIRVNAVAPGMTETGFSPVAKNPELDAMTRFLCPMRRWARPEEIANAVAYLASEDASFVNGEVLRVDGGTVSTNQVGRSLPNG